MKSFRTKGRKRTLSMILTVLMLFTVMNPVIGILPVTRASAAEEVKTSGYFQYTQNASGTIATIVGYTGSEANVSIPEKFGNAKVTTIGDGVFSPATFYGHNKSKLSKITSVTIPEGVTTINEGAFYRLTSLKKVTFPTTLKEIKSYAFTGCTALTAIKIPAKTITIGNYAFCECSGLASITVDPANSVFTSRDNCNALMRKNSKGDTLIQGCKNTVIPSGVLAIKDQAFACIPLKGVFTIPYGVKYVGDKAFIDNAGMTGIVISSTVENDSTSRKDFDYTFGYVYDKSDIFQEWIGTYNDICVYGPVKNLEITAYTHAGSPIENEYIFWDLDEQFQVVNIEFNDVWDPNTYYFDAVSWGVNKGIVEGYADETFHPDTICSRSQMVTFLWRMANKPEPKTTKNPFKDAKDTSTYYYKAMLWAYENKILEGVKKSDGLYFNPTGKCTRQQAVTFLWRMANKPEPKTGKSKFTDVQDPNAYFYKAVLWASEKGITEGTKLSDGTYVFRPQDECARRQMVTFLYRYSKSK